MNAIDKIRRNPPINSALKWVGLLMLATSLLLLGISMYSDIKKENSDIITYIAGIITFVSGIFIFTFSAQVEVNKELVNEIDRLRVDLERGKKS